MSNIQFDCQNLSIHQLIAFDMKRLPICKQLSPIEIVQMTIYNKVKCVKNHWLWLFVSFMLCGKTPQNRLFSECYSICYCMCVIQWTYVYAFHVHIQHTTYTHRQRLFNTTNELVATTLYNIYQHNPFELYHAVSYWFFSLNYCVSKYKRFR